MKKADALPVVLVDDQVAKVGTYPTNEELADWLGVAAEELTEKTKVRLSLNLKKQ